MMGSGKTTTGRLLAARWGWPFLDSDEQVEAATGRSVPQILRESGEAAFRAEERRAIAHATTADPPIVVGVAGGAVMDPDNRTRIRAAGQVVWLRADPATLTGRVGSGEDRPLLGADPAAAVARLTAERRHLYLEVADLVLDVDGLRPAEVVDRIEAALWLGPTPADA